MKTRSALCILTGLGLLAWTVVPPSPTPPRAGVERAPSTSRLSAERVRTELPAAVATATEPTTETEPNREDELSWSLYGPIRRGEIDALRALLSEVADPDVGSKARGGKGITPLRWAVIERRFDAAVVLLEAGASPAAAFPKLFADGETPDAWATFLAERVLAQTSIDAHGLAELVAAVEPRLHGAEGALPPAVELVLATIRDDISTVDRLLAAGVRPDSPTSPRFRRTTALAVATGLGRYEIIERFVESVGGPARLRGLTPPQLDRYAPLARAAAAGDVDRLRALLADGAPVDGRYEPTTDPYGAPATPPLHYAAAEGQLPSVRALLAHGADVDARIYPGSTITAAAIHGGDADVLAELLAAGAPSGAHALIAAIQADRPGLLRILLSHGARVDDVELQARLNWDGEQRDTRQDLLCRAAHWGRTEAVRELIRLGARVDGADGVEFRPVQWAAYMGRTEILAALLQAGASAEPMRSRGPDGRTPLRRAVDLGWTDIAEQLTAAGMER